jgi:hypothetical protein
MEKELGGSLPDSFYFEVGLEGLKVSVDAQALGYELATTWVPGSVVALQSLRQSGKALPPYVAPKPAAPAPAPAPAPVAVAPAPAPAPTPAPVAVTPSPAPRPAVYVAGTKAVMYGIITQYTGRNPEFNAQITLADGLVIPLTLLEPARFFNRDVSMHVEYTGIGRWFNIDYILIRR